MAGTPNEEWSTYPSPVTSRTSSSAQPRASISRRVRGRKGARSEDALRSRAAVMGEGARARAPRSERAVPSALAAVHLAPAGRALARPVAGLLGVFQTALADVGLHRGRKSIADSPALRPAAVA